MELTLFGRPVNSVFELMVEPESLHSTGTEPTFYLF